MTTAENIGDLRSAIDELKAEQLETFKQFFTFHETYNKEMKELAEAKREVDEETKRLEKSKLEFNIKVNQRETEWIHKNVSNLVYISFKLILVYINLFWFTLTLLCFGILYLIVN